MERVQLYSTYFLNHRCSWDAHEWGKADLPRSNHYSQRARPLCQNIAFVIELIQTLAARLHHRNGGGHITGQPGAAVCTWTASSFLVWPRSVIEDQRMQSLLNREAPMGQAAVTPRWGNTASASVVVSWMIAQHKSRKELSPSPLLHQQN
jgi:hypothetical protein